MMNLIARSYDKEGRVVKMIVFTSLISLMISVCYADNIHLIEEDQSTGYALYRSGKPNEAEIKKWCELGISEVMVLSGDAKKVEYKYQSKCPTLKVIYDHKQDEGVATTLNFLSFFDQWIKKAKKEGSKILFRCRCGCHRTGRLAAYYQMKYQNISKEDAKLLMNNHGKWMFLYPSLKYQVDALHDLIKGRSCSTDKEYCPTRE